MITNLTRRRVGNTLLLTSRTGPWIHAIRKLERTRYRPPSRWPQDQSAQYGGPTAARRPVIA